MLLVLLLGLADFGRVFASSIALEAAARNAAEAAAQQYVQLIRNKPAGLDPVDYDSLHALAITTVCNEAKVLPEAADPAGGCTDTSGNQVFPVTAMCVHDGKDPDCGQGVNPALTSCDRLNATGAFNPTAVAPDPDGPGPLVALPYVEVGVCYRFRTLINITDLRLPFGAGLSIGEIWLEKNREFAAACYQVGTSACN
jgi:hypothetical protein